MTTKRGPGRPPGKHGPYRVNDERRDQFMIRLPAWLISAIRKMAEKRKISAGKLIEKAVMSEYGVKKSQPKEEI